MACTNGTQTYVNIKELPEITDVANGDFLIVETPNGTNILDYQNLLVTLDNTTFGDLITQNTTNIATVSSNVISLSTQVIRTNTFAVFSISNYSTADADVFGNVNITPLKSSNINSIILNTGYTSTPGTSAVTINFTTNFENTAYCTTFGAFHTSNKPRVNGKISNTNYLVIEVTTPVGAFCTADKVCVQIIN